MTNQIIQNKIAEYGNPDFYGAVQVGSSSFPGGSVSVSTIIDGYKFAALSDDQNYIRYFITGTPLSTSVTTTQNGSSTTNVQTIPNGSAQTHGDQTMQQVSVVDLVKQKIIEMKEALIQLIKDFQAWLAN
jgi:hypothetical protein